MEQHLKSMVNVVCILYADNVFNDINTLYILDFGLEDFLLLSSEVLNEEHHDVSKRKGANYELTLFVINSNFVKFLLFHFDTGVTKLLFSCNSNKIMGPPLYLLEG